MHPPRRVRVSELCERLTLWRRRELRSIYRFIVWISRYRNPGKAPLSSFPANDYTPSGVTWAVDSRIVPAKIGAQVPRSGQPLRRIRPLSTLEPISFSECQAALLARATRIKIASVLSFQGRFPGRLTVPAYAVSRVASPSSPKHYRMNEWAMEMRSPRIRFVFPLNIILYKNECGIDSDGNSSNIGQYFNI